MKILNVSNTIDPVLGGGEAERSFQMSRFLARSGADCRLLTIDTRLDAERRNFLGEGRVTVLPCLARRFHVPRFSFSQIDRLVAEAEMIHLIGHWSVLNVLVYLSIRRQNKPYVVCPAGALPLFGRSRWLKRFYNLIVGNSIIKNASGWIAVTEGEFPQFEEYGIPRSRVTVIPNGVSVEDFPDVDVAEFRHRNGLPEAPVILFMGRLNPIKGPDLLLQAFLNARHAFPEHHLVFAGPDGGMLASLRETAERSGVAGNVHFLGYVGGADKSAAYHMADLLVVPSRQEAMSIVAIEAGICGVPVLLTDQCGFGEIRSIDARLEVPASVSGIADGLTRLLADPGELEKLSPAWSNFVERKYSWTALAPEYLKLYQRILAGAAR
jgi:glycosyltransferase involved in cell wall biosynthesis